MACIQAMEHFLAEAGTNPWYSIHKRARKGDNLIEQARADIAWLLGISNPRHLIFTLNATDALNRILYGVLQRGDVVFASHFEHASVTRPLAVLRKERGIKVFRIGDKKTGIISEEHIREAFERKSAKLIVLSHASNVTGAIQPIEQITRAAHEHKCAVLVDCAQTAGILPVKAAKWGVDFLAFSGHKHLLGPMGVGGFYVADPARLKPVIVGAVGHWDYSDEIPSSLPHRYEPGTPNAPGIVGLGASCRAIKEKGIDNIRKNQQFLLKKIISAFKKIPGIKIYGPLNSKERVGLISFNISQMQPQFVGDCLDNRFDIMVRTGLCSAHWAHEALGTEPDGVIRASFGYFTKEEEIDLLIEAVEMVAQDAPHPKCCK